jgi:hypothetical protein
MEKSGAGFGAGAQTWFARENLSRDAKPAAKDQFNYYHLRCFGAARRRQPNLQI